MLLLLLVFFSSNINATGLTLFELEVEKSIRTNRSRNIPKAVGESTSNYANVNFNIEVIEDIYWHNKISTEITDSQFRYVALDFSIGMHFTEAIDVYYRHYSGHVLDYKSLDRFNEENSVGLRIKLK